MALSSRATLETTTMARARVFCFLSPCCCCCSFSSSSLSYENERNSAELALLVGIFSLRSQSARPLRLFAREWGRDWSRARLARFISLGSLISYLPANSAACRLVCGRGRAERRRWRLMSARDSRVPGTGNRKEHTLAFHSQTNATKLTCRARACRKIGTASARSFSSSSLGSFVALARALKKALRKGCVARAPLTPG